MATKRRWLRDRRRIASGLVVALVIGVVAALSLTYRGVATADVELNDGGVWVTNESSVLVGRLNFPVRKIDATLAADTPDIDLVQREDEVVMIDPSAGLLRRVDTAGVAFAGSAVDIPGGAEVGLGDDAVAVLDPTDGRLWVTTPSGMPVIEDPTIEPVAVLGEGATMAVGDDGTVHVLDVVDHEVLTFAPEVWRVLAEEAADGAADEGEDGGSEGASPADDGDGEPGEDASAVVPEATVLPEGIDLTTADVQITVVGDRVLVLAYHPEDGTLQLLEPGVEEPVDLSGLDVDLGSARLQAPSVGGDVVALTTSDALVTLPIDGGDARVEPAARPGPPVQPVQVAGCVHGAWAGDVPAYLRVCGDGEAAEQEVPEAQAGTELTFRVNRANVVLNDLRTGDVWMIQDRLLLVQDWEEVISSTSEETETEDPSEEETDEVPLDRDAENRDPVANPDDLAGRPGRTVVLPVLDNDTDADGDLLTVASVSQPPSSFGTVEAILGGRALQVRLAPDASGSVDLEYGISDGRGGSDTTTLTITARAPSQNADPVQVREITPEVVLGESVEVNLLNDVRDPDGDEIYLVGASADDTVNVTVRPDGMVTITDLAITTGLKQVTVQVSDGLGDAVPVTIDLQVLPDGAAPPQAVFDFATGFVGEPIVVRPLENDLDPNGRPLDLAIVTPTNGGEQTTNTDDDSFVFEAGTAGSYYLTYVVTDDDGLSAEGLVRIDVRAPRDAAPIAVSDDALLPPGGSVAVDVLENDEDPGGGVLAVQSIDVPSGYGLQVAILDHRILRITSERALSEPVTLGYTVSNGTQASEGEVVVLPLSGQTDVLRPVANPDTASVRAGDHVTVPVLRNDSHPNGVPFELTDIEADPEMPGLPFVSGDLVRYAAPDQPGTYQLTYRITDDNGQSDSAVLTIYVEARTDEANAPPRPADIEVRAFAGERIRIPVDLYGIDPDGDSVQLIGPTTSPERGRIATDAIGTGYLDYVAYNSVEGGTDTFEIAVQDRLGAIGTATVTVGVIPPPSTNRPPVTTDDTIEVRPDRDIQVDVILNDTDPDGDQLQFSDTPILSAPEGLEVGVEEGLVVFTSPSGPGDYTIQYQIDDTHGGRDSGALTVTVDPDADPLRPVAVDDLVPAVELIEALSVDVEVLANDYDPDGSSDDLQVSLPAGQEEIEVLPDGRLRIPVTPTRQVVTYQVTDPDGESTYAFVEVPGTEDTGPVLLPGAELEVDSGEELLVDLSEWVVSLSGDDIRLYDNDGVTATNSDGGPYVVDEQTLRFVSAAGYAGPASLTFSVTDSADINDTDVLTSVLTIPITVNATTAQPPTFRNGSLELEAGGDEQTLDLSRLAADPDTETADLELSLGDVPDGFSASLENGVILSAGAALDTPPGTSADLPVLVDDGTNDPVEGVVTLTATSSTADVIVAVDDQLGEVFQGEAQTVDVLANDTDPVPPRTIVDAFVETGTGSVDISGDSLVITPSAEYVGRLVVTYTVADGTEDPDRWAQARVSAVVLGIPETPPRPVIESVGNREVTVSITPPNDNGSPITAYEVSASGAGTTTCANTICRITGLQNDVEYTFTVVAINAVGPSEASAPSAVARPDTAPGPVAAPSVTYDDSRLALAWTEPVNEGSDITEYDIQISPAGGAGSQVSVDGGTFSYTWEGLTNGTEYRFRLRADNDAPDPGAWGAWSRPEYPSAPPAAPAAPRMERLDNPAGGQVQATWSAPADNGDSIDVYHVTLYRDGAAVSTVPVGSDTLTRVFDVENGHDYAVSVVAENRSGRGPASAQSAAVTSFGQPAQVPSVTATATGNSGQIQVAHGTPSDNGQAIQRYEYRLSSGGSGTLASNPANLGGLNNGTAYTVQVRACNTYCGDWSASSNAASPYGPPAAPTVGSSANLQDVTFTWSSPASSNGAGVVASRYRLDGGGWQNVSARNGTVTVGGGWEQNHSIEVQVRNEHNQWSSSSSKNQRSEANPTPPNPPGITMLHGRDAQGESGCTHASCAFLDFNYRNLPSGNYTIQFYASTEGSAPWRTYSAQLSGTDRYNSTTYRGQPGEVIRVVITSGGNRYEDQITWPNS